MDELIDFLYLNNVEIVDIENLKKYIEEKSVYRYKLIAEKLLKSKKKLNDIHLHDFYKYDIKVRRLLFKYLTAYEIRIRSRILNSNVDDPERIVEMTFGELISNFNLSNEVKKVKKLRNYVFHHRMIQLLPLEEILAGINSMLRELKFDKFIDELYEINKKYTLIYHFYESRGQIVYGINK